jgi:hypothetical protein
MIRVWIARINDKNGAGHRPAPFLFYGIGVAERTTKGGSSGVGYLGLRMPISPIEVGEGIE